MSEDILCKSIYEAIQISKNSRFIFHGGEPLLVGRNFFELAINTEKKGLQDGRTISNSVQTNATLIDSNWIDLFKKNNFGVGISIDGPQEVHDFNRRYLNGEGSFKKVFNKYKLMNDASLNVNALAVITSFSIPRIDKIFNFFSNHKFNNLDFIPCVCDPLDNKMNVETLKPHEYAKFMINYYDKWAVSKTHTSKIRWFNDVLQSMMGLNTSHCIFKKEKPCGKNIITINMDGEVYICDHFVGLPEWSIGNIMDNSLSEMMESRKAKNIYLKIAKLPENCYNCFWISNCHGDCTYYRYLNSQKLDTISYYCNSNKLIFKHIFEQLKEGL